MLDGEMGEATQLAMRLLVGIGKVENATRMISISSAHISGVSYQNIGDEGLEFLEELVEMGGRVRVPTTLNPCGIDMTRWRSMRIDEEYFEGQKRVLNAYVKLGATPTCTCTPYLLENIPAKGEHLAWAESSAVIYVNSFIGAYTNREGGLSALAAALTGRTPYYGLHLDSQRRPQILINVEAEVSSPLEYGLLGYVAGAISGSKIPAIRVNPPRRISEKKQFAGGFSASGSSGMAILSPNLTSEFEGLETVDIGVEELKRVRELFAPNKDYDIVFMGCPHLDASEVRELAAFLRDRRIARGKEVWVAVSRRLFKILKDEGVIDRLRKSGVKVFADACLVVAPVALRGAVGTDAIKTAHYLRSLKGVEVALAEPWELLAGVLE